MVVYCRMWHYMVVYGSLWWFIAVYGGILNYIYFEEPILTNLPQRVLQSVQTSLSQYNIWLFMVLYGSLLWFMVVYGGMI